MASRRTFASFRSPKVKMLRIMEDLRYLYEDTEKREKLALELSGIVRDIRREGPIEDELYPKLLTACHLANDANQAFELSCEVKGKGIQLDHDSLVDAIGTLKESKFQDSSVEIYQSIFENIQPEDGFCPSEEEILLKELSDGIKKKKKAQNLMPKIEHCLRMGVYPMEYETCKAVMRLICRFKLKHVDVMNLFSHILKNNIPICRDMLRFISISFQMAGDTWMAIALLIASHHCQTVDQVMVDLYVAKELSKDSPSMFDLRHDPKCFDALKTFLEGLQSFNVHSLAQEEREQLEHIMFRTDDLLDGVLEDYTYYNLMRNFEFSRYPAVLIALVLHLENLRKISDINKAEKSRVHDPKYMMRTPIFRGHLFEYVTIMKLVKQLANEERHALGAAFILAIRCLRCTPYTLTNEILNDIASNNVKEGLQAISAVPIQDKNVKEITKLSLTALDSLVNLGYDILQSSESSTKYSENLGKNILNMFISLPLEYRIEWTYNLTNLRFLLLCAFRCGKIDMVLDLLKDTKGSISLLNYLGASGIKLQLYENVLKLIDGIHQLDVQPDATTLALTARAFSELGDHKAALEIMENSTQDLKNSQVINTETMRILWRAQNISEFKKRFEGLSGDKSYIFQDMWAFCLQKLHSDKSLKKLSNNKISRAVHTRKSGSFPSKSLALEFAEDSREPIRNMFSLSEENKDLRKLLPKLLDYGFVARSEDVPGDIPNAHVQNVHEKSKDKKKREKQSRKLIGKKFTPSPELLSGEEFAPACAHVAICVWKTWLESNVPIPIYITTSFAKFAHTSCLHETVQILLESESLWEKSENIWSGKFDKRWSTRDISNSIQLCLRTISSDLHVATMTYLDKSIKRMKQMLKNFGRRKRDIKAIDIEVDDECAMQRGTDIRNAFLLRQLKKNLGKGNLFQEMQIAFVMGHHSRVLSLNSRRSPTSDAQEEEVKGMLRISKKISAMQQPVLGVYGITAVSIPSRGPKKSSFTKNENLVVSRVAEGKKTKFSFLNTGIFGYGF